jgi:hypothetical protein
MCSGCVLNGPNARIQGRQPGHLESTLRNQNWSRVRTFPLFLVKVHGTRIQRALYREDPR